jgi:hypothetical protein
LKLNLDLVLKTLELYKLGGTSESDESTGTYGKREPLPKKESVLMNFKLEDQLTQRRCPNDWGV